jgi:hypothetical protein
LHIKLDGYKQHWLANISRLSIFCPFAATGVSFVVIGNYQHLLGTMLPKTLSNFDIVLINAFA